MDRFAINSQEGDLPREYVVRNLYTCPSYDPYTGRACSRKISLAHKDVSDYRATAKVKENRETGRLEVSDVNENRSRGELRCDSILAVTGPLENSLRDWENNTRGAMTHVPQLINGFLSIRQTHAQIKQETMCIERCPVTRKDIRRLGENPQSWLMDLCEEYVIQSFAQTPESGFSGAAFPKLGMDSPVNENVKLCLSVMTQTRLLKLHAAQTDATVMVLEKHVGNWPNKAVSDENGEQKQSAKGGKNKKSKLQALLDLQKGPVRNDVLTPVPDFLRQFSEAAISTIKSTISCCSTYYPTIQKNEEDTGRPEENWALLALSYFIEAYTRCTVSPSEDNMLKCRDQYNVYVSFAEYHVRHLIMARKVPIDAVERAAQSAQSIRESHSKAKTDASKLKELVEGMKNVSDIRELLPEVKLCASATSLDIGTTEQSHSLTKELRAYYWSQKFQEGTFYCVFV